MSRQPLSEDKIKRLLGLAAKDSPEPFQRPVDGLRPTWWQPTEIDREYQEKIRAQRQKRRIKAVKDSFFQPGEEFVFAPAPRPLWLKILTASAVTLLLVFTVANAPAILMRLKYWFVVDYQNKSWPTSSWQSAVASERDTLKIEKIGLSLPIFWKVATDELLEKGKRGVVHLKNSPLFNPNQPTVIYGLSSLPWWSTTEEMAKLALLDKLVVGDTFTVTFQSKEHRYRVSTIKTYPLSQQEYLPAQADFCLVSSTPIGTTIKRLVICGEEITSQPTLTNPSTP